MLPAWRNRLASARVAAADAFTLRMGDETCALRIVDGATQLLPAPAPGSADALLTPGQLVQLVFGYRPVYYLATQPGAAVPAQLLPLLDTLFPAGQPWIPWSDGF
ncbi:MAG TPA: sterol carrier protein domain-containing protein, partial [Ktedonobacterales bacterium]|nr:sterol carrier protein domain-containing protein [Ktedonobacterales bacterium]